MQSQEEIKSTIAKNLIRYRKLNGYTQVSLAELLNYTDKAISKWERAESLPDIAVLKQLADLYNIMLDELVTEYIPKETNSKISKLLNTHKLIIPILSAVLVWLIATIVYVFMEMFTPLNRLWLCFIYAIPVSLVVLVVFSSIWGNKILAGIIVSMLVWSLPLAAVTSLNIDGRVLLFVICVPMQILVILWYVLIANIAKNPKRIEKIKKKKLSKKSDDSHYVEPLVNYNMPFDIDEQDQK